MTNREVAIVLDRIADILQIKEDNLFKVRAYRKAARSIYHLDENIHSLHQTDKLGDIPGVGKAVKQKIEEMLQYGTCEYYQKLLDEVPEGVLDMLSLPGIGHKTVKTIYEQTGIDNLEELYQAAQKREIRNLPGMGAKTEYNIKKGFEMLRQNSGKVTLGVALPLAEELRDYLLESKVVEEASLVGSIRRGKPLVSDIDILVAALNYEKIYDKVSNYRELKKIDPPDEKGQCISGKLVFNISFEVIVVPPPDYFHSLVWTTGSKSFRETVFSGVDRNSLSGLASEEAVFTRLNLDFIPPQIRENRGEIEAARAHKLPQLLTSADIKGDLHVHSNWSDGAATVQDMAAAAQKLNYNYLAITDHSKSLPISGGVDENRLSAQSKLIDQLNIELDDFKILKGIEVDILKDGQLDFNDDVLEELDVVIASIHSNFKLDREKQTDRIVNAIKNQHVDIIGHLSGRLLNRRSGYEVDLDTVLENAAKNKVALEINSHPDRLDVDEDTARLAVECGVKIAINSDAHHPDDLRLLKYGVLNARRGWLKAADVINTWDLDDLTDYLKE